MTNCANIDCNEPISKSAKYGTRWCSKTACQRKRNNRNVKSTRSKHKKKTGSRTVAGKEVTMECKEVTMEGKEVTMEGKEVTISSVVTNTSSLYVKESTTGVPVNGCSTQRIQVPEETVNLASIVMWSKRKKPVPSMY